MSNSLELNISEVEHIDCKDPQVFLWEETVVMEQRSLNISNYHEARVLDDLSYGCQH